jgi:hypothetical protein
MKTLIAKTNRYSSGWEEIGGHGCQTEDELHAYAAKFSGKTGMPAIKVVDLPFDPGTFIPEEEREWIDPMPELTKRLAESSPEEKARVHAVMQEVVNRLRGN